jgi:glycosyl transferase family 25
MNALVINLKSSIDRLEFQKKQLDSLHIGYAVIEAVEASQLDENFHREQSMSWERPLRKSELACCLSHVSAWEKVIKEDRPYLILEDDAILHKDMPSALSALSNQGNYDCVNFETRNRKKIISKTKIPLFAAYTLSKIIHNKSGAAAYLLWPSGAQILYNYYKKNGAALADAILANCDHFKHFQIEPALAIQIDCCADYNIVPPIETASNISQQPKPTSNNRLMFAFRRLKAQAKILFKQLITLFSSKRTNVPFYGNDTGNE